MDIHGCSSISMDVHEYPWRSMDCHEIPYEGYPRISMNIHGDQWISMNIYACPCISTDIHGHRSCIHGDPYPRVCPYETSKSWSNQPPTNQLCFYVWCVLCHCQIEYPLHPTYIHPTHLHATHVVPSCLHVGASLIV